MRVSAAFLTSSLLARAWGAPPPQIPLGEGQWKSGHQAAQVDKAQKLHGRFLQVTDFHPDRFYQVYSSTDEDSACHRGHGPAGIYGAETSECDSPVSLVNKTMEWIAKELKDTVDFVIWTGDSARHDNDEEFPRTEDQVLGLNEFMVHKMAEVFGKNDDDGEDRDPNNAFRIPIVPNLGNNDILPHNILAKGPNKWLRSYSRIWKQFIPEAQQHSFQQGGWYYVEVIPHKLAVFSLNTLYFFGSNAAADGCAARSEPGYQQMEWLRIQLQFMRDRGMKAMLIGHVPPVRQEAKTSWDETCWQKYALFVQKYRDVIVSTHYGHFNYDHFMFQDFKELNKDTKKGRMETKLANLAQNGDVSTQVKSDYFIQLREKWSNLPEPPKVRSRGWLEVVLGGKKKDEKEQEREEKKYLKEVGGEFTERFAASFVGASVVPNLFPTMRIFEYNTSGLEESQSMGPIPLPASFDYDYSDVEELGKKKKKKHKKKHKKVKFTVPDGPSKTAPPGPAYSPQTLSLIKFTQYFANLTFINNDFSSSADSQGWHEGKHKGRNPPDNSNDHDPRPKEFKYEKFYDTKDDDVYQLQDLTMPNLVDLARRIGHFVNEEDEVLEEKKNTVDADSGNGGGKKHEKKKKKKKKKHKGKKGKKGRKEKNEAWYTFVRRAYVDTLSPDEIEDQFGD